MSELSKVVGRHLLVLAFYTLVCAFFQNVLFLGISIAVHSLSLFIISVVFFIRAKIERAKRILVSALLVGLIGFSACYGIVLHTILSNAGPPPVQYVE